MINKRLLQMIPNAIPHIRNSVMLQMIGLFSNVLFLVILGEFLVEFLEGSVEIIEWTPSIITMIICITIRIICVYYARIQSYLASKSVKEIVREQLYHKVMKVGKHYTKHLPTGELLQLSVEGVEQLETYFGNYLPQFFYAMIAPLLLFGVVSIWSVKIGIVLFVCVPLIPISMIVIQKIAKKLLSKYWGEYAGLADHFLENLQGLNALKIYETDKCKQQEMNQQAERFRIVTMKVLSMQLNSIIVMDVVAYGGAALGMVCSLLEYGKGNIGFGTCFFIILLAADFFLPLRLLGSYFHIAMNGVAASKKIFTLLDLEEEQEGREEITSVEMKMEGLSFSYTKDKVTLKEVSLEVPKQQFISIVGKSGCGKSTIASLITGVHKGYTGSLQMGGKELSTISARSLGKHVTYISANAYIFKGTVRDNLSMANPRVSEEALWKALEETKLADFLRDENGLDTMLLEKGSNFSGGQCQRLAIARALLADSQLYIFDEATSNIDVESENCIVELIHELSKNKSVFFISHRLANVVNSDMIYVMEDGRVKEEGTHQELIGRKGVYEQLWKAQKSLEELVQ
ncbi:MAG: ABC transporter ATP-binding protein/permease [Eubacteriales bacterium]